MTAGMYVYTAAPLKEIRFFYNADGLRTRKQRVLGGRAVETTDYILHGKLVTHMKVTTKVGSAVTGTQEMHFFYDAQSRPALVDYNGQKYTYVHNLQGDIAAILDNSGAKVVEYRYDAWGRDIGRTLTSDIGELNPFRYRGYVYDEETGLYYLRSRYYSAEIGRFVSRDLAIGDIGESFKHNGYCYARNIPVSMVDVDGYASYNILYDSRPDENNGGKGFPVQAEWIKDQLSAYPDNEIETIGFQSVDDFINKWNQMDSCDYLIIIGHGAEGTLDCNGQRLANSDIDGIEKKITHHSQDLRNVEVRYYTILLTCHGATKGRSGYSLAKIIANKTGTSVYAAKNAKVNYFPGTGRPYLVPGKGWKQWLRYIIGGWVFTNPDKK